MNSRRRSGGPPPQRRRVHSCDGEVDHLFRQQASFSTFHSASSTSAATSSMGHPPQRSGIRSSSPTSISDFLGVVPLQPRCDISATTCSNRSGSVQSSFPTSSSTASILFQHSRSRDQAMVLCYCRS
ncbi:hypothetical protein M6B38_123465 [Iris pallida]|uniref:Uncharacterized protein n=1 Tax=Iris pallida TaxID=29817 RepID=A0AAX6H2H8_IRIPA|nr:hypothetical protein M6B38_123465 [Iris pallida]